MRRMRRLRHKWEDNVKMDLWKIWLKIVDWIHLVEDQDKWWAFVNTVMKLSVP
jgi:hypothetical protein